jgi:hypothetical protein
VDKSSNVEREGCTKGACTTTNNAFPYLKITLSLSSIHLFSVPLTKFSFSFLQSGLASLLGSWLAGGLGSGLFDL